MGKHRADNEHQQHSKKRRGSSSTADGEAVKASKLIRYAAVGRYRKVRSYLRDDADLARLTDSTGSTALHEVRRFLVHMVYHHTAYGCCFIPVCLLSIQLPPDLTGVIMQCICCFQACRHGHLDVAEVLLR